MGISGAMVGVDPTNSAAYALSTSRLIETEPIDMKSSRRKLLEYLEGNSRPVPGGKLIEVPIMYSLGQGGITYISGDQPFATMQHKGFGSTMWNWKVGIASTVYGLQDRLENTGPTAIANIVTAKTKQTKMRLYEQWATDLLVGNASAPEKFTGMGQIVATSGQVGGVNPSDSECDFWAAKSQSAVKVGKAGSTLRRAMLLSVIDTSVRGQEPDTFWFDPTGFDYYWEELQPQEMRAKPSPAGTGTLDLFFHRQKIEYDGRLSAGTSYLTNKWSLQWCFHPEANWTPMPGLSPTNQLVTVVLTVCMGELTCLDRALNAVIPWTTADA